MENFLDILSSAAIVIFIMSALPQIQKLLKQKTANDVSLWMSLLISAGNFLMLVRSIAVRDIFFLINYAAQLALWVVIVVLILRYRKK